MNLFKKLGLSLVVSVAAFVAEAEISFGDSYCFHKNVYFDGMEVELEKSCELQFYTSTDPYGHGITKRVQYFTNENIGILVLVSKECPLL